MRANVQGKELQTRHVTIGIAGAIAYAVGYQEKNPGPTSPSTWLVTLALQHAKIVQSTSERQAKEAKVGDFLRVHRFQDTNVIHVYVRVDSFCPLCHFVRINELQSSNLQTWGYYACRSTCCLMGFCSGSCCSCPCSRRERKLARTGEDSHKVSIEKVCTADAQMIATTLIAAGNYCLGKDPTKVDCFTSVLDDDVSY